MPRVRQTGHKAPPQEPNRGRVRSQEGPSKARLRRAPIHAITIERAHPADITPAEMRSRCITALSLIAQAGRM